MRYLIEIWQANRFPHS